LFCKGLIFSNEAKHTSGLMLNATVSLFRMILLILGGYEQVALEYLALREQLAIFQRSVRHLRFEQPTDCFGTPISFFEKLKVQRQLRVTVQLCRPETDFLDR